MSVWQLTIQACADLDQIWLFIAEDNPDAADRLIKRIAGQFPKLAENPGLGRARDDLARSLRSYPAGNYIIF